jgi:hypothetical protein
VFQTTDENWKLKVIKEAASLIYKVINMYNFGSYILSPSIRNTHGSLNNNASDVNELFHLRLSETLRNGTVYIQN